MDTDSFSLFLSIVSIIATVLILFPLFWVVVVWLISRISGWHRLAAVYAPQTMLEPARCWSFQSALMRASARYRGVVKICADDAGLHFSVLWLFRPGHSPFFVPWEEIRGETRRELMMPVVLLRFDQFEDVPLAISPALAGQLQEASAGRWSYRERPTVL